MNPSATPPLWQIWRNPIVRRYAVARLRPISVIGWSIPVQAVGGFLWLVIYLYRHKTTGASIQEAATAAWIPILILQGILWIMKGTFSVAVGIAREGVEGLTDAQRLTPLRPAYKVLGYLLGAPILETVLVASLLPWTAVSVILGKIPLVIVFRVHLLLVTAAILHHAIGLVTGTVIRQKIVAGTVSQLLVIVLHLIVPLFARLGAGPLGHLGVESAMARELEPLFTHQAAGRANMVRFFQLNVTLTGYQWLVMSILLWFLLSILWRKWKRADAHLFSKPIALTFFAWILVMSLGEISPKVADGTLFAAAGRTPRMWQSRGSAISNDMMEQGMAVAWAGAVGCVALVTAMLVASIITPTLDQHWCALRALRNREAGRMPWTSDAHGALAWVAGLGLLATGSWYYLVREVMDTPLLTLVLRPDPGMPWILAGGLLLPLLVWGLLLELRGMRDAFAAAFVFWIIPIMVVVVAVLSGASITGWPRWLACLSGFALPFLSLLQASNGLAHFGEIFADLRRPWLVSIWVHAGLAVALWWELRKAQRLETEAPKGERMAVADLAR
jgi:hypothetical protein